MGLASEDSLCLNVLLRQQLEAVRIDESQMMVYGLSAKGEAKVPLHANCKDERYLKQVRQLLSTQVLGSPGGYPVYLKRWTRMGQARDASLEKLLLLGEPEAVAAVVHAAGLTDELARRAWWVSPTEENARRMLERPRVAKGKMGCVLADFLVEFLPFEADQQAIIDSVRLVLQPGLIATETKQQLWAKGKRKNTYYVGFLIALPNALPIEVPAHPLWTEAKIRLEPLAAKGNSYAKLLCHILSPSGQAFLETAEIVLRKPLNQDVVVALLEAIGHYFQSVSPDDSPRRDVNTIGKDVIRFCQQKENIASLKGLYEALDAAPKMHAQFGAMLALSMFSEQLVAPIFGLTDAIGSVMRKKIAPITKFTLEQFALLRSRLNA